jgi:hypothetical protein
VADLMTGMYATTAILGALEHRHVSGQGQYIDIALLDCLIAMTSFQTLTSSTSLRQKFVSSSPSTALTAQLPRLSVVQHSRLSKAMQHGSQRLMNCLTHSTPISHCQFAKSTSLSSCLSKTSSLLKVAVR